MLLPVGDSGSDGNESKYKEVIFNSHYNTAQAYLDLGETDAALKQLALCLENSDAVSSDSISKVFVDLGQIHFNGNDFDGSLRYYEQALSQHESVGALMGVGTSLQKLGDLDDAFQVYVRGENIKCWKDASPSVSHK